MDEAQAAAEVSPASTAGGAASTLIEFPGTGRANANRPQWRKELSERVREIQSRRAREAALEAERAALRELEQETLAAEAEEETVPAPLGLVASNDTTPLNPLVVAALRRIERARQPPPRPRVKAGGVAAALARAVKEQYETSVEPEVAPPPPQPPPRVAPTASASETETRSGENAGRMKEASRPSGLIVVRPAPPSEVEPPHVEAPPAEPLTESQPATLVETVSVVVEAKAVEPSAAPPPAVIPVVAPLTPVAPSTQVTPAGVEPAVDVPAAEETCKPAPRRVCAGVIDDHWLDRREVETRPSADPADEHIDDRAPLASRFVGAVIDLVVIAFIASPFAAIIELTSGQWSDPRVAGSMVGILITVMLLYMIVSTGLAGRTLGMWLLSLRVVDVRTAMVPQTGQSVRRAVAYVMSLAAFGLGFLYALLDAEGRAAHDHLSGTMVVRD